MERLYAQTMQMQMQTQMQMHQMQQGQPPLPHQSPRYNHPDCIRRLSSPRPLPRASPLPFIVDYHHERGERRDRRATRIGAEAPVFYS